MGLNGLIVSLPLLVPVLIYGVISFLQELYKKGKHKKIYIFF